jgi:coenzyme Q-binding protein COQ10
MPDTVILPPTGGSPVIPFAMRMPLLSQKVERVLSFCGPEQLFDLAADVERYPEFQRWWIAARIRKWEGDSYYTDQVLGFGPIRVRFGSKTVLHRPERIDVTSDEPPFRRFALSWIFEPQPRGGCRVTLAAEVELRSARLQRLMDRVRPIAVGDMIAAFEARARALYAPAERNGPENR